MNACSHKTDKKLNITASLKKQNKEEDGEIVHFYQQVNHGRPQQGGGIGAGPWTGSSHGSFLAGEHIFI